MGLMRKWIGLAILVLGISAMSMFNLSEGKGYELPVNCKRLECPSYEVIDSQDQYEIRSYKDAIWVSTFPINSSSYKDAAGEGFNILFSYIQGKNDQAAIINMTAPVLVNIFPSTGPFCNSTFVVNFYLPENYQNKPPKSEQTHPVKLPEHKYAAVRRFSGFMDDNNIPTQASALKASLKGTNWESSISKEDDTMPYSVAGYNSPFEIENRVNEVMFWFDK